MKADSFFRECVSSSKIKRERWSARPSCLPWDVFDLDRCVKRAIRFLRPAVLVLCLGKVCLGWTGRSVCHRLIRLAGTSWWVSISVSLTLKNSCLSLPSLTPNSMAWCCCQACCACQEQLWRGFAHLRHEKSCMRWFLYQQQRRPTFPLFSFIYI